jgi:hypothetical protein
MITHASAQKDIDDLERSTAYWATRAAARAAAKTIMEKVYFGLAGGLDKVTAAVRPPEGTSHPHFAAELMQILRIRYHAQGMAFEGEWVGADYRVVCKYSANYAVASARTIRGATLVAWCNVFPLLGLLAGKDRGTCVLAFFVITASALLLTLLSGRKPGI